MNTILLNSSKRTLLASLLLLFVAVSCERSVDGLEEPGFTENPEVFIDGFSAGLEYLPFGDSKLDAFSVDNETTFDGTDAAMRFDVPNVGSPDGSYAGAIFRDENGGRDLTNYDALTFYAKATTAGTINDIGFGQDFFGNEYQVTFNNLRLATYWQKYVIPIPDASKLTQEQGMFWYAEGPEDGDGYSFWIDELKFESFNGVAQPRPAIQNGDSVSQVSFIGSTPQVSGLTQTLNFAEEGDITVAAAPAYFDFTSSNPSVATVDETGSVTILAEGDATITASLNDTPASGALVIESQGEFNSAPTPTEDPSNVISIFSDAYDNVPVDFYNGFYEPFQTTTSNDFTVNGDNVLGYENFNFVGIEFNQNVPTIDGSEMTTLTLDVFIPGNVPGNANLAVSINDFGADGSFGGGDDTSVRNNFTSSILVQSQWIELEVDISGMANRSNLGQMVLDTDSGPGLVGSTIYVDNIYLYNDQN
jgi:hypothetical protein